MDSGWPISLADQRFIEQHAESKDGALRCKTTGAAILQVVIGRSIWNFPFPGGFGEVRKVAHLWCPQCGKEPAVKWGEPIYDRELIGRAPADPQASETIQDSALSGKTKGAST